MKSVILFFIKAYRWIISPLLGNCCRFYPSCSSYAEEAIQKKGSLKGLWLAGVRILKCNPFHPGGVDVIK